MRKKANKYGKALEEDRMDRAHLPLNRKMDYLTSLWLWWNSLPRSNPYFQNDWERI